MKQIIYRNSNILRSSNIGLNKFLPNVNKNMSLIGGGKILSVEYKEKIYKFNKYEDTYYYVLYSQSEDSLKCASIIISKEYKTAEVHGISNYKSCLQNTNENIGSHLLQLTLKMLKKYHKMLGIDKISLTDNSIKKCGKKDIIL